MKSTKYLEGLQERKTEILAELAPYKPLVDELQMIERLLEKHQELQEETYTRLPPPVPNVAKLPHRFEPDPNSHTSQVISEAKRILEASPRREMSFLRLYHEFPGHLNGSGTARERARIAIQRAGKRAGIEYVNKDKVRLVAAI